MTSIIQNPTTHPQSDLNSLTGFSYDRQNIQRSQLKEERQSDMRRFLAEQANQNPRLRRLMLKNKEPVTSIQHTDYPLQLGGSYSRTYDNTVTPQPPPEPARRFRAAAPPSSNPIVHNPPDSPRNDYEIRQQRNDQYSQEVPSNPLFLVFNPQSQ